MTSSGDLQGMNAWSRSVIPPQVCPGLTESPPDQKPFCLCCGNFSAQSKEHIPSPRVCRHFLPLLGSRSSPAPTQSPALRGHCWGWSSIPQIHGDCTDPVGFHCLALNSLLLQALPACPSPFPGDDPWVSPAELPLLATTSVSAPSLPNKNSFSKPQGKLSESLHITPEVAV